MLVTHTLQNNAVVVFGLTGMIPRGFRLGRGKSGDADDFPAGRSMPIFSVSLATPSGSAIRLVTRLLRCHATFSSSLVINHPDSQ